MQHYSYGIVFMYFYFKLISFFTCIDKLDYYSKFLYFGKLNGVWRSSASARALGA